MVFLIAACTTLEPTWIESPGCSEEPYGWSDDLGSWVNEGDGSGAFALDPPGDAPSWVEGSYDAGSGAFDWTRGYGDDYWRVSDEVEGGEGTVYHNGDLSLEYVVVTTDKLDTTWRTGWRVERIECAQEWWTWDAEADEPVYDHFQGSFSRTSFSWEADVDGVEWSGTRHDDGSSEEDYEAGKNEQHTTRRADGTSRREFTTVDTNYTYEGSEEQAWNGNVEQEYSILDGKTEVCTVSAEFDYDGDGTATYECGNDTFVCDYKVDKAGACTYSCDDGSKGDC